MFCKCGLHVFEDHFFPEIINPETLEVMPPGEKGVIVFSTITKEAFPVLRYRTRDISSLDYEKCACGRTHVRMSRVTGRSDDMLIIRGVNVFPSQIESVLLNFGEVAPHYQLIVDRIGNLDTLEVWVEMTPPYSPTKSRSWRILKEESGRNRFHPGIGAKIKLVEPKTIERSEGKAKGSLTKEICKEENKLC